MEPQMDFSSVFDSAWALASAHKWLLLAATLIGVGVRLTKPDVRWVPNVAARWRPLVAAGLGVVTSCADKIVSGGSWQDAVKFGLGAAATAMLSHTFAIEVARNGTEILGTKPQERKPGDPPSGPTGNGQDMLAEDVSAQAVSVPPSPRVPPKSGFYGLYLVALALGCSADVPKAKTATADVLTCVEHANREIRASRSAGCVFTRERVIELLRTDPTCVGVHVEAMEMYCADGGSHD